MAKEGWGDRARDDAATIFTFVISHLNHSALSLHNPNYRFDSRGSIGFAYRALSRHQPDCQERLAEEATLLCSHRWLVERRPEDAEDEKRAKMPLHVAGEEVRLLLRTAELFEELCLD